MEWNFIVDLESSEVVWTSGMQYDTAQAEFTTTSQFYQNILNSDYSTHAKYLNFNSQMTVLLTTYVTP